MPAASTKPRMLSSQPKRKWGDEDSEEENSTPDFVLNSEEWPLTPPKPARPAQHASATALATGPARTGGATNGSGKLSSNNKPSTTLTGNSTARPLTAKPSFTNASKLAPIFGAKPANAANRATSVPPTSTRVPFNAPAPSASASAAYSFNQASKVATTSAAVPKKRHLPWDDLEAATKKPIRQASSNFHELAGPGGAQLAGVKGKMLTSTSMDIKQKVLLSPEQQMVHKLVVEDGKSVFFTGSAGTGKSVLLREIISSLKRKHRGNADAVAVTASTGMAACNIGGTTIHSFAGIGIGAEPALKLIDKVKKNRNANAKWQRCKVLVVDEVSMVDGILFDKLAEIGKALKKRGGKASAATSRPFGGIQLVVTGDFFQLPPVTKGVVPTFAFEAKSWKESIDHTVNLTQVFRQKDTSFIDMLNEMRFGQLTAQSIAKFKMLSREPKYAGCEPTELFPMRHQVDQSNQARLRALKGEAVVFKAEDWAGDKSADQMKTDTYLNNFMASDVLTLKIGAQVMLIKNLDATLVNGTVGTVIGFGVPELEDDSDNEDDIIMPDGTVIKGEKRERTQAEVRNQARIAAAVAAGKMEKSPVIDWQTPQGIERKIMAREEFKVEDNQGRKLASRKQYPVILAWAMSIHKSQGQTIARVKVDLGKVFEKGQSYVALSRATSLDGLQVLNFDARKVLAHQKVIDWSKSLTILGT
ncbi:uncharacterized protein JCM15063_004685 [Sporobolomyces koalae]|uniref:uncharacterized protein n=1 Tax=Sporobolomyces koalae TaxID=500713 RepID=UPI00317B8CD9